MKQFSYVLTNDLAHQAKPVGSLSKEAARFSSRIRLIHEMKTAELSDPRSLLALDMQSGNLVTVRIEGTDEEDALAAMQNYFVSYM